MFLESDKSKLDVLWEKANHKPDEQGRERILKAWQEFQSGNPVAISDVRPAILDSWKRSKQYNVDAFHRNKKLISTEELRQKQDQSITFLNAAHEYLEYLFSNILGHHGVVTLSNAEGVIFYIQGDEHTLGEVTALELGSVCSEEILGTNGIGTCLALRKPIHIWAEEHYNRGNHQVYSSGAPIFDSEGNIFGCLNITGTLESEHAHTQGMVIAIANAIERQIRINKMTAEHQKVIRKQAIMLELISDGVVIVDPTGKITDINNKALQLTGMAKNQVIGQPLKMFISSGIDIDDIFTHGRTIKNLEIDFALPGNDLSCRVSADIIRNEQGLPESIVLTFTKNKTVHALVNQVTGSMAKYTFEKMIGSSQLFKEVIRQGKRAALTNSNVLITGESGTGKELMAQSIHNAGSRAHMPFVAINCGALPRGLVESELFGYEGGSFTGSKKAGNPGKFELADGGTIFLDEIGDMPLDVQVSLLRVIQEKEVCRIGGSKPKKIDIRIIAATNKNLEEEVVNKTFRRDLYYRLNVLSINMPSLRKRKEDLEPLINSILERIKHETGKPFLAIDGQAMNLLKSYDWPGNVRELENILERAANTCRNFTISKSDIPFNLSLKGTFSSEGDLSFEETEAKSPDIVVIKQTDLALIMNTLSKTQGNIKRTAEILGIARNTIYRKLKKHNIPNNFWMN